MTELRHAYAERGIPQVARILSLEDRNPFSPTYGSFDRTYWLDRAIDFPTALAQFAVHTLSLVYSHKFPDNIYYRQDKIKNWCIAGMDYWTQVQKNDGSFDEFYPNERGWAGPTGFTLYAVLESYKLLKKHISNELKDRLFQASYKAAKYLGKYDEQGILANHHAVAMLGIYTAYDVLKDESLLKGYNEKLDYFLTLQSPEGWSLEYDGADIGYLSATVSFLGKISKMHRDERLDKIMRKAVEFTSYFVYPNKFYAGSMGSRQTLHFYPHGYELLADKIPLAGMVADKMLEGLRENKTVTPEIMPDRYLVYRVPEFLLAWVDHQPRTKKGSPQELPFNRKPFTTHFPDARILVVKNPRYYLLVNLGKGGVVKLFDLKTNKLTFNDCGILGKLDNGRVVSSQWVDPDYQTKVGKNQARISGNLHRIPTPTFTPLKMIAFRSLLVTFGKSTELAYGIKGRIRDMLITKSKAVPIGFTRDIKYNDDGLELVDSIDLKVPDNFSGLMLGDEVFVRYVPQSMYFQSQELDVDGFMLDDRSINKLNSQRKIKIKRVVDYKKGLVDQKVI